MSAGAVFTAPERLHDRVPLASAMFCQDCSMITNAPDGACAYCASRALLSLANVLDRKERLCDQVPLASATLCTDCGMISNAPGGACAHCASRALLLLANVLDREGTELTQGRNE